MAVCQSSLPLPLKCLPAPCFCCPEYFLTIRTQAEFLLSSSWMLLIPLQDSQYRGNELGVRASLLEGTQDGDQVVPENSDVFHHPS